MRQPANPSDVGRSSVKGELVQHPSGISIADHVHHEAQLTVVLKGTMKIACKGGWWLAPAGRGIWIPAGVAHCANYSEAASFILLKIDPDAAKALSAEIRSITISDLLKELALEISRDPRKGGDRVERELMSQLIVRQIRNSRETSLLFLPSARDVRVLRVMQLLRADPANDRQLDELARMAGSSRRTMSRLFLSETGMSFARWRDHLRIVTALDMLVRGVPILQIAVDLGYNSQSSFTTMFTRIIGIPPARYLRDVSIVDVR